MSKLAILQPYMYLYLKLKPYTN